MVLAALSLAGCPSAATLTGWGHAMAAGAVAELGADASVQSSRRARAFGHGCGKRERHEPPMTGLPVMRA